MSADPGACQTYLKNGNRPYNKQRRGGLMEKLPR
mgnify:CR=1 FL=1